MNLVLNQNIIYAFYIFLGINLFSFFVMYYDKWKSENHYWRISEKTLFILAFLFGGIGIYFGMFVFHHKTKKWYFILGIPFLIALNLYLLYQAYFYLSL